MATATEFVDHAARITQVPYSTLAGYHRNFKETGTWKSARGPNIPQLSTPDVVLFLLAILTDPKAKDAASTARATYSLRNGNEETLGNILCRMIDSLKTMKPSPLAQVAYKTSLAVDCECPRACLTLHGTDGEAHDLFGIQAKQWDDTVVLKSMTISGRSLFQIGACLYRDRARKDSDIAT